MAEYMIKVKITAAGTYRIPIKKRVLGVYSAQAVKVGWDFNGEVGDITPQVFRYGNPAFPLNPPRPHP